MSSVVDGFVLGVVNDLKPMSEVIAGREAQGKSNSEFNQLE